MIISDEEKVMEILINLISNSIKFTEKGSIELFFSMPESLLRIKVRDTGIGIAKEFQYRIFNKFWQLDSSDTKKYAGTGLGLAIAKELVDLLQGHIQVESMVGQGTTMYLEIPVQLAASTENQDYFA
jgi:signal transduction histidine kinase